MIQKVIVKYNNKIVGYLIEMEDKKIAFQYDEEWIKSGFSISPFSLPLTNKIYINQKQIFDIKKEKGSTVMASLFLMNSDGLPS